MSRAGVTTLAEQEEARLNLASVAARAERHNQPRGLVYGASVLLLAALIFVGVAFEGSAGALKDLKTQRDQAQSVIKQAGELKALHEAAANGADVFQSAPQVLSRIQQAALDVGLKGRVPIPSQSVGRATVYKSQQRRFDYPEVKDESLPALLRWMDKAVADVPGLEVYAVTLKPDAARLEPAGDLLPLGEIGRHMMYKAWIVGVLSLLGLVGCAHKQPEFIKPNEQSLHDAMQFAQQAQDAEKLGNHDKAVELNKRALQLEPGLGGVWNNLGLALMHRAGTNDFVDSEAQSFKRAADLLPTDDRPYQNLGVLYHQRGFSDEALRYFVLALDRNPNSIDALRGAIASTSRLGKSDEASLARINRALMMENDPTWHQIMEFERIRMQEDIVDRAHPNG